MTRNVFKQVGKGWLVCALVFAMALAAVPPTMAAELPQSQAAKVEFGDIGAHWAKDDILAMCQGENPLFKGTGDVNGVPMFSPDSTMSGHEFIAVIVRAMYPHEIRAARQGEGWWAPTYEAAAEHNLVPDDSDWSGPISRQEMAKIMAKVLKQKGEDTSKLVPAMRIPDYDSVGDYYKHDVRVVYSLGIITGKDGNVFAPRDFVDRAQGATILHRLLDSSCRATADFTSLQYANGQQEFKEGENHYMPQVGDVVIKADGTRITIEKGIGGVLGAGQGVDIWTGTLYNNVPLKEGMMIFDYSLRPFVKDSITGEMHTEEEWDVLRSTTNPSGKFIGDYEGEVYNTWWEWSNLLGGSWGWIGPTY